MQRRVPLLLALAVVAAACGAAGAAGPPEINYGRDICIECGMSIDDPRFATAYRLADGTEKKFDDIGDMIIHMRRTGDEPPDTAAWVHDFETEEWVAAADAHFVPTLSEASPMGHSILAFSEMGRARAFADDVGGEVIAWSTVMALPETDGLVGHHHDHDMGDSDMDHDEHDHDGTDDMDHSEVGSDDDMDEMDR
jgi:copper chaperone NosL